MTAINFLISSARIKEMGEWRLIRSRRNLYANWASLRACERFGYLPLICRFIVRKLLHLPRWFSFKVLFNWTIKAYGPAAGNPIQGRVYLLRPKYCARGNHSHPEVLVDNEHYSNLWRSDCVDVCVWFSRRVIAGLSHFGPIPSAKDLEIFLILTEQWHLIRF